MYRFVLLVLCVGANLEAWAKGKKCFLSKTDPDVVVVESILDSSRPGVAVTGGDKFEALTLVPHPLRYFRAGGRGWISPGVLLTAGPLLAFSVFKTDLVPSALSSSNGSLKKWIIFVPSPLNFRPINVENSQQPNLNDCIAAYRLRQFSDENWVFFFSKHAW